jgi:hypothetical protein
MRTVKGVLWLLAGVAFTVGLLYFGVKGIGSLRADQAQWKNGTVALEAQVQGREKSNRVILKDYELEVEFLDQQRGIHKGKTEFTSLFTGVDQERPVTVHYDVKDPSHFALSWAVDVAGGRWMAAIFFILMAPVLGVGAIKLARNHLATPKAAPELSRAAAGQG